MYRRIVEKALCRLTPDTAIDATNTDEDTIINMCPARRPPLRLETPSLASLFLPIVITTVPVFETPLVAPVRSVTVEREMDSTAVCARALRAAAGGAVKHSQRFESDYALRNSQRGENNDALKDVVTFRYDALCVLLCYDIFMEFDGLRFLLSALPYTSKQPK